MSSGIHAGNRVYVACDDSGTGQCQYTVIGSVFLPIESARVIEKAMRSFGEFSFNSIRRGNVRHYISFIDEFFFLQRERRAAFRCLVGQCPRSGKNPAFLYQKSTILAIYTYYAISRNLRRGPRYSVLVDEGLFDNPAFLRVLNNYLGRYCVYKRYNLDLLKPVPSDRLRSLQVADLLAGSVRCLWNQHPTKGPKADFARHVYQSAGFPYTPVRCPSKLFNVWPFRPSEEVRRRIIEQNSATSSGSGGQMHGAPVHCSG